MHQLRELLTESKKNMFKSDIEKPISVYHNNTTPLNLGFLQTKFVNYPAVKNRATNLKTLRSLEAEYEVAWLLKAITCIDLTTLSGDDCPSNVRRLCVTAAYPLPEDVAKSFDFNIWDVNCPIKTAAVCVYPAKVEIAYTILKNMNLLGKIKIAAVATGFPSGQYSLETRLSEIHHAVKMGADEIDIVIDRSLVLEGKWNKLYDELVAMRKACGSAHMKSILAIGELENMNNVYKASIIAMMAGSDFIKTSTGKESINATLSVGIVMARAIIDFKDKYGRIVGLKPAGGIRTATDALNWLVLVKEELGTQWLSPELFRFGASGLLDDIVRQLSQFTC